MEQVTVNRFIEILKMAKDIDIAPLEFWAGEKEYELESLGQFGIMANVTVHLKEVNGPQLRPAVIQKKHRKKANAIVKKIQKEHKKK
jgi:hypothetical protein